MKTYKIGRGTDCQVSLLDEKISRNHALIRVHGLGKMEIVDLSQNGTFVNGMRIPPNTPFPVKRKDVVTFAHAEKLNWSKIPDPIARIKWYSLGIALAIAIITGGVCLYNCHHGDSTAIKDAVSAGGSPTPVISDKSGTKVQKTEEEKKVNPQKKFHFPEKKASAKPKTKDNSNAKTNTEEEKDVGKKVKSASPDNSKTEKSANSNSDILM